MVIVMETKMASDGDVDGDMASDGDVILPVLEVLIGERVVGVAGLLMPVGTLLASLAFALHPEGADVRPVSLVVRGRSGQLL